MKGKSKVILCLVSMLCVAIFAMSNVVPVAISQPINTPNNTITELTQTSNLRKFEEFLSDTQANSLLNENDQVRVIVELENESLVDTYLNSNQTIDFKDFASTKSSITQSNQLLSRQQVIKDALSKKMNIEFRHNYTGIMNGFSATIKYGDFSKLVNTSGIKNAFLAESYSIPNSVVENDVHADPVTGIYDTEGIPYDGTGKIIAVLDTGIDYHHPSFQTMPTDPAMSIEDIEKIVENTTAYQKTGASTGHFLTAQDLYVNEKIPFAYDYADNDPDAFPQNSHGTHVSGIVAGQDDIFKGVATNAQIAFFKVFSTYNSSAYDDNIFAALNDAMLLGVDVINMSLGASAGFGTDNTVNAVDNVYNKIYEAGISLLVAAGNDYSSGVGGTQGDTNLITNPDSGTVGTPASYNSALAVASIQGTKAPYLLSDKGVALYLQEAITSQGEQLEFVPTILGNESSKTFEYVKVPGIGNEASYGAVDVTGKIAVVKRGTLSFKDKASIAAAMGAVGCIIYNNVSGIISANMGAYNGIAVATITMDNSAQIPASGTLTVSKEYVAGPFMSRFSSWGVLPNLELKPDITAHGGNIISGVIGGGHQAMSGTSMAAPNLAGAVVLIRQALNERYPDLSQRQILTLTNRLMMSTATIALNETADPYSPRLQGAGLADVFKTINSDAYLYVEGSDYTKLSLGDDKEKTGNYVMNFSIQNDSDQPKTYKLSTDVITETVSSDEKTVAERPYPLTNANITYSAIGANVTNDYLVIESYSSAQITANLQLTQAHKDYLNTSFANGMYVEGFVKLTPVANEEQITLSIPYVAFYGDWTQAPIFDESAYDIGESLRDPNVLAEDKLQEAVYATAPLGVYSMGASEYYFPMGTYVFAEEEEMAIKTYGERAAISMQGYNVISGVIGVYAGLLRAAKSVDLTVTNNTSGNVIHQATSEYIRKSYASDGSSRVPGLVYANYFPTGLADNTSYTMSLEAKLDYEGEQNNLKDSFEFEFFVDSQKPILREIDFRTETVNKVDRHYLDITVYDNHYAQAIYVSTFSNMSNGVMKDETKLTKETMKEITDVTKNSETVVTIDITDSYSLIKKNNQNIYIEILDYAMNYSSWSAKGDSVNPATLEFDPQTTADGLSLNINQTIDLNQYLNVTQNEPKEGEEEEEISDFIWEVSDANIAMIKDGQITGLNQGTITATVYSADKSMSSSVQITVTDQTQEPIKLEGLVMDEVITRYYESDSGGYAVEAWQKVVPFNKMFEVKQGDVGYLSVTTKPWNVTADYAITWKTADSSIIKITTDPLDQHKVYFEVLKSFGQNISVTASVGFISYSFNFSIKQIFVVENNVLTEFNGTHTNGVIEIPVDLDITSIGSDVFFGYHTNNFYQGLKKIIIPHGVTSIESYAFSQLDTLEEVVLPTTLKNIASYAFAFCFELNKINLEKVEYIGFYAFQCTNLSEVDLSNCNYLAYGAFSGYADDSTDTQIPGAPLKYVDLSNVSFVGSYAFFLCIDLVEIKLSKDMTIDQFAFRNSGLVTVKIPFSNISYGAFAYCSNLTTVVFETDVRIEGYAFRGCSSLKDIVFNGECSIIGVAAFYGCLSLTEFTLPKGLKTLDQLAFLECINLEKVIISKGANFILDAEERYGNAKISEDGGINAFKNCPKLTAFEVEAGNTAFTTIDGILYDISATTLILCPPAKDFSLAPYNGHFEVPASVRYIGAYSMADNTSITKLTLNNVIEIGDYAFFRCVNIYDVTFNQNQKRIGESAFEECSYFSGLRSSTHSLSNAINLEYIGIAAFYLAGIGTNDPNKNFATETITIELPKVKYIGSGAFAYSTIYSIIIPTSVTAINANTFYECSSLFQVTFRGQNLIYIDDYAFYGCKSLEEFDFPITTQYIGISAFAFCLKLNQIDLPSSLIAVGEATFESCASLKSVKIRNGLTYLSQFMFYDCENLATVDLGASVTTIYSYAFYGCYDLTDKGIDLTYVEYIGDAVFPMTAFEEFNVPNATYLGAYLFFDIYNSNNCLTLLSVYAPKATTISDNAFIYCENIQSVNVSSAAYIGVQAFYFAKITTLDISNAEFIGRDAFAYADLKTLTIPASLKEIDDNAFSTMPTLTEFIVSESNSVFFTDNGVLYSHLKTGGYQLEAYPMGKSGEEYTVIEGTKRISAGAFYWNLSMDAGEEKITLKKVTFPRSLQFIGDGAFAQTDVTEYVFNSYFAPTLECYFYSGNLDYSNFIDLLKNNPQIKIYHPENGVGYGDYVYQTYFTEIETTQAIASDAAILAIEAINKIPATVTLADQEIVAKARVAYNAVTRDHQSWVASVIDKLIQAEATIQSLTPTEKHIQVIELINQLPEQITLADKEKVDQATNAYNALTETEKAKVTNLERLTNAQEKITQLQNQKTKTITIIIVSTSVVIVLTALAITMIILIKKGKIKLKKRGN